MTLDPAALGAALADVGRHVHPDDRPEFQRAFQVVEVDAGQAVVHDGTGNDALWVVADGRFAIEVELAEGVVDLATIGPGGTFGELSLLTGAPATATIRARGPGHVLRLDARGLGRMRDACPAGETALLRALAEDLAVRLREGRAAMRAPDFAVPERRRSWLTGALSRLVGRRS